MTIRDALIAVYRESKNEAASAYAHAAVNGGYDLNREELYWQIQYVLSNLGGWRGERAREVKAVLKAYKKEV